MQQYRSGDVRPQSDQPLLVLENLDARRKRRHPTSSTKPSPSTARTSTQRSEPFARRAEPAGVSRLAALEAATAATALGVRPVSDVAFELVGLAAPLRLGQRARMPAARVRLATRYQLPEVGHLGLGDRREVLDSVFVLRLLERHGDYPVRVVTMPHPTHIQTSGHTGRTV